MIKKLAAANMGRSDLGWLNSWFHFSFAEYYNPSNMNFGVLRVINDDQIQAGTGFDMHPHRDMEIITYVVDGELTHGDSMKNQATLHRGEVQYMSAGTGIVHSEHNRGSELLRLLQIWIFPDRSGYVPQYGDFRYEWKDRENCWLHLVSGNSSESPAPIKIHQDINLYVTELSGQSEISFHLQEGRQAYLVQIEGTAAVTEQYDSEQGTGDSSGCECPLETILEMKDAAEIHPSGPVTIHMSPRTEKAHLLLFEMAAEKE